MMRKAWGVCQMKKAASKAAAISTSRAEPYCQVRRSSSPSFWAHASFSTSKRLKAFL